MLELNLVMLMYNLIEHSSKYSDTTGSLWFYSEGGPFNFHGDVANTADFQPFKYTVAQPNPNKANLYH